MARRLRLRIDAGGPGEPSRVPVLEGEGLSLRMKVLAAGNFSRIHSVAGDEGHVVALTRSPAFDKRAMAVAHELAPDNPHLPAVELLGREVATGMYAFRMPRYRVGREAIEELRPRDRIQLDLLERCWTSQTTLTEAGRCLRQMGLRGEGLAALEALEEAADVVLEEVEAWERQIEVAHFEVPERNVAVSESGRLVWLDVIYYAPPLP